MPLKKEANILIAEDNDAHAALIKKILREAGIENPIIRFKDGKELLDFLLVGTENKQDCIEDKTFILLLDLHMPHFDGFEVLRRIKANEELKKMPVIILTTTSEATEVKKCHHMGCSNYIAKPTDHDNFVKTIKKIGYFLMILEIPTLRGNCCISTVSKSKTEIGEQ
ncbi:MAG: response regulator [bacterium]|nr:response regulator [bacterium]